MRILSWNIACLPREINLFKNPRKSITQILDKIFSFNPDIVKLQEVFDFKIQDYLLNELISSGYNNHVSIDDKNNWMSKNGLLTSTKYPIIKKKEYTFKNFTSVENFINKGILTTEIYNSRFDKNIFCHNTHIQSDSMIGIYKRCRDYRNLQYNETLEYFKNNDFNDNQIHILSGDLNEDYNNDNLVSLINDLTFKTYYNTEKIITFPYDDRQLDYIITNINKPKNYLKSSCDLSDHNILILDIE